jgi:dienelactone hydrolase
LAKHEKIDEKRIGIMGFSYGASLALVSATSVLTDEYTKRKYEYSAHIPLYGLCWAFKVWAEGGYKYAGKDNIFQSTTGAPVHILAGEKDQYEIDPEMCSKFVNALPNDVKNTFDVTVYPGALHGWDTHENRSYNSKYAYQGKGGRVFHERDEATAEKSVKFAVEFFQNNL